MIRNVVTLFLVVVLFSTSSCRLLLGPQRATVNYVNENAGDTTVNKGLVVSEPVVQKTDILTITITSASLDPAADALYNLNAVQTGAQMIGQQPGYLVDAQGNIEMPRLGKMHVEGLTKNELEKTIKAKLNGLLTQPTVIIRFSNFRVTVLGEVKTPTVLTIPTEHLTILEAIGMTGGITEFGSIKQVRVLRENNGTREIGLLNLTSQDVFKSKFYQLQQNDVVLVDQTSYKFSEEERARRTQLVSLTLAAISTMGLLYSILRR